MIYMQYDLRDAQVYFHIGLRCCCNNPNQNKFLSRLILNSGLLHPFSSPGHLFSDTELALKDTAGVDKKVALACFVYKLQPSCAVVS